jgi:DNA polymerase type B, organellar and viral
MASDWSGDANTERCKVFCTVLAKRGDEFVKHKSWIVNKKEAFWKMLYDELGTADSLWLFGFRTVEMWHKLDLWGELENEKLAMHPDVPKKQGASLHEMRNVRQTYAGGATRERHNNLRAMPRKREGYIIAGCPPAIASLYGTESGKLLTWVDAANFGQIEHCNGHNAAFCADEIVKIYIRLYSACVLYDLGPLKQTAASQAMHIWRNKREDVPIYCHTDKRALVLEEEAYYGGRCECLKIGELPVNVTHLDVKSMYAACMKHNEFPTMLEEYHSHCIGAGEISTGALSRSIARVLIRTDSPRYPKNQGDYTIWPIGSFWTTLAGPELVEAHIRHNIVVIDEIATYKMDNVFTEYVDRIFDMRKRAFGMGYVEHERFAKSLLVSLSGKLSQQLMRWQPCLNVPAYQQWGEWYGGTEAGDTVLYRAIAGKTEVWQDMGYAENSVPAIGAFITSYARMVLLHLIDIAHKENVYYYDTDSLIVSEDGYERLIPYCSLEGCHLGHLYIKARHKYTRIIGIKQYIEGDRIVCAGMPRSSVRHKDGEILIVRDVSLSEQLRRKQRPHYEEMETPYKFNAGYHHGNVSLDGAVTPFVLNES